MSGKAILIAVSLASLAGMVWLVIWIVRDKFWKETLAILITIANAFIISPHYNNHLPLPLRIALFTVLNLLAIYCVFFKQINAYLRRAKQGFPENDEDI